MTAIYGIAIAIGAGGILATVGLSVNESRQDIPDRTRRVLLAVLGFGLAGMSASFGGWAGPLHVLAAIGGAAILVGIGERYRTSEPQ